MLNQYLVTSRTISIEVSNNDL